MIIGTGIDHVQGERMKEMLLKWADRVENRVFDEVELEYSRSKGETHLHLAARFAAKEALFKALGKGLSEGMTWTDVKVVNDESGKPSIDLKNRAREIAEGMGVKKIHVSLTHTDDCAVAMVILEG
ncbi:MAG: holo-ACP synthase [bacterium]|nr:holo-ACP synthase [bacterium]MDT8396118.1 holo-ACP synthase [bacterium]